MIAKLRGKVVDIFADFFVLETGNVGYRIEGVAGNIIEGQELTLYIYTHVREQELRLFGFRAKDDLRIFELLLTVSGVGPKTAINLVNAIGTAQLVQAIASSDTASLKAPGIGGKTAERVVLELKNKVEGFVNLGAKSSSRSKIQAVLRDLGYNNFEIDAIMPELNKHYDKREEEVLKIALKLLNNER